MNEYSCFRDADFKAVFRKVLLKNDTCQVIHCQCPDFDMSSFFPCEIDGIIQYINLGYGTQAPKIVIL